MNKSEWLRVIVAWGPLWFGFGFLAPVIAQSMEAFGWFEALGMPSLAIGLLIGGGAGVIAKFRGSWV